MERARIAYLQKAPSGHADACLRALQGSGRAELFVTMPPNAENAPYDRSSFGWIRNVHRLASLDRDDEFVDELRRFRPDVTLIVGWESRAYRRCARALRGASLRVVCMDNQWRKTPKQLLGVASSRVYLRPYFDAAFLPGSRQREFALRLGFRRECIFEGFYSADVGAFARVAPLGESVAGVRDAFVFVGRLVPSKGVRELLMAYEAYRSSVAEPWRLLLLGAGPLEPLLVGRAGVEYDGFVEPAELPERLARASFLVLPSTFEPWGVAVHEAAAAGLGCICSSRVGAADAFVHDGINGRIVSATRVDDLAQALRWAHERTLEERRKVSAVSRSLAAHHTPERWAETVLGMAGIAP